MKSTKWLSSLLFLCNMVMDTLTIRELTVRMNDRYRNKIPSSDTVLLGKGVDVHDCVTLCLQHDGCSSIIYRKPQQRCYGYDGFLNDCMKLDEVANTYVYEKLDKSFCESRGFRDVDGICYRSFTEGKNWTSAQNHCQTCGGNLIMFQTNDKYLRFISNFNTSTWRHYIGLSDIAEENSWVWIDGTSASTFGHFVQSQPQNYDKLMDTVADCAMIRTVGSETLAKDVSCSRKSWYVCEILP